MKINIFLFSGQGSQYYRMGNDLYNLDNTFKETIDYYDALLKEKTSFSIKEYIFGHTHKEHVIDQLNISHPAIVLWEYALCRMLQERNIHPSHVLGSSLGEYTAAVASGILSIETVLEIVLNQAIDIMNSCDKGFMITVFSTKSLYWQEANLYRNSKLISFLDDKFFVISGLEKRLDNVINVLNQKKVHYSILPVKYAFHTNYIHNFEGRLTKSFNQFSEKPSAKHVEMISGGTGEIVKKIDSDYFIDVVYRTYFPTRGLLNLRQRYGNSKINFFDLSIDGSMTSLVRNSIKQNDRCEIFNILGMYGSLEKNMEKLGLIK